MSLFPFLSLSLCQASNPIDVAARPGAVPHTLLQKDPRVSVKLTVPQRVSSHSVPPSESHMCTHSMCLREMWWLFLCVNIFLRLNISPHASRCTRVSTVPSHFGHISLLLMIMLVCLSIQITDPFRTSVRVSGCLVHLLLDVTSLWPGHKV